MSLKRVMESGACNSWFIKPVFSIQKKLRLRSVAIDDDPKVALDT